MISLLVAMAMGQASAVTTQVQPAPIPTRRTAQEKPAAKAESPVPESPELLACTDLATGDPTAGQKKANEWLLKGGGFEARQCLGYAMAQAGNYAAAADELTGAAKEADSANAALSARIWSQAGNAALAAGQNAEAKAAFDAALARGTLTGLSLGETHLDRARALVALDQPSTARADIEAAKSSAGQDPLVWLLSATLARRMDNLPLAQADIAKAVTLSPDDASVALEEGNIAILSDDAEGARKAWQRAVRIDASSPAGKAAAENLSRLQADQKPGEAIPANPKAEPATR